MYTTKTQFRALLAENSALCYMENTKTIETITPLGIVNRIAEFLKNRRVSDRNLKSNKDHSTTMSKKRIIVPVLLLTYKSTN